MSTVRCIECGKFSLKDAGENGKRGLGECAAVSGDPFRPLMSAHHPRQCKRFVQELAEVIANRKAFLALNGSEA